MKLTVFAKDTLLTSGTKVVTLVLGLLISIILARGLGPEGKGIYTLAVLFPALIITVVNLGIGPATVYYVAQDKYSLKQVLGSDTVVALILGAGGSLIGLVLIMIFPTRVFPEVARVYLLLALVLVPADLFRGQVGSQILLGARRIKELNAAAIIYSFSFLVFLFVATVGLGTGVAGAIWASALSSVLMCIILFFGIKKIAGGLSFRPALAYVRGSFGYGLKTYVGNLIGFLNYRVEIVLLGVLMTATVIGFYSVAVGLAEKLWLVSQSAAMLIFPVISAEKDEQKRKDLTALVSRSTLLVTSIGAVAMFLLSRWIVVFLYSERYLPTVPLFRILLPGIVFLSVSRILANDIAGRGKPLLNTYVGGFGLVVQVALNLALIPRYGAMGSAWATSVSYGLILMVRLWLYMKVSGNSLSRVILPQSSDLLLYRRLAWLVWGWAKGHVARS